MAFKIESFETMNRIAERIDDRIVEMTNERSSVVTALDNLKTNIECDGITATLDKLSYAVSTNTESVNQLLTKISNFIVTQTAQYAQTNATAKENINTSIEILQNIK